MDDEKIKNIISGYIKKPADDINAQTIIDRSAVANSILLHRMYASLQKDGIVIDNYLDIKTYGSLLQRLTGKREPHVTSVSQLAASDYDEDNAANTSATVGIDIEDIALMPRVNDFREDAFYTMNFSSSEIAYCILQSNPLASFAGLFAAKEAIVKADNAYKNKLFNTIIIEHLPWGKPVHPYFQLSISHSPTAAVGMAISSLPSQNIQKPFNTITVENYTKKFFLLYVLCFIAIVLSAAAIVFCFYYK